MISRILLAASLCLLPLGAHAQTRAVTANPSTGAVTWPAAATFRSANQLAPASAYEFTPVNGGNVTLTDGGTAYFTSQASIGVVASASTITLPAADAYPSGTIITISDISYAANAGGYLTFLPGAGDNIAAGGAEDSSVPVYLGSTGTSGAVSFATNGTNLWRFVAATPADWHKTLDSVSVAPYVPENVAITGGSISGLSTFANTGLTSGATLHTAANGIVPLSLKVPVTSTADIQQWYFGATKVASVNYVGSGSFSSIGIADGGNYVLGGTSFILRTTGSNAMQIEGGNGDFLIDKIIYKGLVAWEVEGDVADDHETTVSFEEPTGNDTNYRFAKQPTADVYDVSSTITKATTGDPTVAKAGTFCYNSFDTNFKVSDGSAWRTIIDW